MSGNSFKNLEKRRISVVDLGTDYKLHEARSACTLTYAASLDKSSERRDGDNALLEYAHFPEPSTDPPGLASCKRIEEGIEEQGAPSRDRNEQALPFGKSVPA